MDGAERARRFLKARTELNQHGAEPKTKVYAETGVPASALVDYEDPESKRGLNVANVQKLAAHYKVNAAWLLGQSDSWSLDTDIRQVSEMTGLSPEAIQALQELMKDERQKVFINGFLASKEFSDIVQAMNGIRRKMEDADAGQGVDYTRVIHQLDGGGSIEFKEEDLQDMRIWRASRALETVMRELAEE